MKEIKLSTGELVKMNAPTVRVLKGADKELAEKISQRLNAIVRITKDGGFATLTLRNGETILDVVSNPDNKDIIKYLSIDYKSTIAEVMDNFGDLVDLGFTITPWTSSFDWNAKEYLMEKSVRNE